MKTFEIMLWDGESKFVNAPCVVYAENKDEALIKVSVQDRNAKLINVNDICEDELNEYLDNGDWTYLNRKKHGLGDVLLLTANMKMKCLGSR